ncbi:MAG: efflux RND transporter periplasmic adaptor subunit [Planctomycetota bacterium]|nr:efflux RND transporter periplasmic adaptor subunit [Planctomycetota bacterium]
MKRNLGTVMWLAVGALTLTLAGCTGHAAATTQKDSQGKGSANPAQAAATPQIGETKPDPETPPRTTTQPARIEPFEQAPLYAKIEGYVLKSRTVEGADGQPSQAPIADIGDLVKENDVLAEIWVPEMEQELRQKQALHAQAEAELEQAAQAIIVVQKAAESAQAKIREAEAGVMRAEGEYQRWEAEKTRIQQLAGEGSVSQKLADETLNQFRAADAGRREVAARVDSAKAALGEAEATVAKARADEAAATARLEVAQANVDHMQSMLAYAKIRAPFAGVVTQRNVDTGHLVRPPQGSGSPSLFVVVRADVVRIVTEIPELEAPLVKVGNRVFIRIQALGGEEIEGQVTRTAWVLDPSSRTLRTEIDLPNPTGRLRPGMYATARIILEDE